MLDHGALGGWDRSMARPRRLAARNHRAGFVPGVEPLEGRVVPATITVTNTNNDGAGSLRAAIELANTDAAVDIIDFASAVAGTITLLSALPDLSTDVVLSGPGASVLTVSRNSDPATSEFRILTVTAGAEVTIAGLTISGGQLFGLPHQEGGGISNAGTLTIADSIVSGNTTNLGGGISNAGTLTVANSIVSGNTAIIIFRSGFGYGSGGGISNTGTLTVANSTLRDNRAVGSDPPVGDHSSGGGISNAGTLTVANSTLQNNSAGLGGGISNDGTLTVANSTLQNNSAGLGGGISNRGTLTVANSTLQNNSARAGLGGFGGSGGGISNEGTLTVANSTLSDNSARSGFGGYSGSGGGISNAGTLTVAYSTLSGNSANFGGGVSNVEDGNSHPSAFTVASSLFANALGGNLYQSPSSALRSRGHNLFSDAPTVALDPTDLINTDPLLGPLADHGGPTQTNALLPGSPAIDAGGAMAWLTADQRGVPRLQGAASDIGAFESRGFTLFTVSGDHQSTTGGSAFPSPLVVRVASLFGEPIAGGCVRFAGPTTGASAVFAGNPALIDASGQAAVVATANGLGGAYVVTAQAAGAAMSVGFALENLVSLTVLGLQRVGVHTQPTVLVLSFSASLDPARAQDVANYRLVTLGGHGRGGARVGFVTGVRRAVYDPATQSVTLHLSRRLDLRNTYQLTVRGTPPTGLTSSAGVLLDGAGTGQAGSDFVATITRGNLVGSSRPVFNQIRHRWASTTRITSR